MIYFSTQTCPVNCEEKDDNEYCNSWAEKGYCTVKFSKFMQKKCPKSCCLKGQRIVDENKSGSKQGTICDFMNIFNDDKTEPPVNYMEELVLDTVNCHNAHEIKVI
jgi:hypothetical protein